MTFFDTHCHIHEIEGTDDLADKWHKNGITNVDTVLQQSAEAGVAHHMVVGCTVPDSELAIHFAQTHAQCYASIGIHPHEAAPTLADPTLMERFERLAANPTVTAIGECGLDYYYTHSPKADQATILHLQLKLAQRYHKPLIFHVRDAFADFWPMFDQYEGLHGVVHSFTATEVELRQALDRGLYIGLNGIMTFTKDEAQLQAARQVPLDRLILETDAPFLTPKPFRGTINIPAYVRQTAEFLAGLRHEPLEELAAATTANARRLFGV